MAGIKRKEAPVAKTNGKVTPKKAKTAPSKHVKPRIPPPDLEAETDSDPIVESDTTEHSGDDDGVSWPSGDEENGGVALSTARLQVSEPKPAGGKDNGNSSAESHAKQRAVAQERKMAKPHADFIARSKKIWERLRRQSHVPLDERKELVRELFDIITGRVKDFVLKHDGGRVVQTALKYGNLNQRRMIARELKGEYRQLAEGRYAKFTIGKILVGGDTEIRDLVVPEFYGNVRRLIKHPEASWILDDVYRGAASRKQKALLLKEWYGAEFAIFKAEEQDMGGQELKDILAAHPEKRSTIMNYLFQMIDQLVQKKTTGFTMLHDAMLQYYLNVVPSSSEATDFIELLKGDEEGDLMKNLAFTPSGSRLVSLAFAHSTAKDRKTLLRTYKSVMPTLSFDPHGHQVLLSALSVIDDTVLTSKSIYSELLPKALSDAPSFSSLLDAVISLNARIPLLYPFVAKSRSILPDDDVALMAEVHAIRAFTSKKDPDIRRHELAKHLAPTLLALIALRADDLVQSSFGCVFMMEVLLGAPGDSSERGAALQAIVALLDREDLRQALETPAAGRMLKTLVLSGRFSAESKKVELCEKPLGFAGMLWGRIKGKIVEWAVGRNGFVVVGFLESEDFGEKEKQELKEGLRECRRSLEEAVDKETASREANKDRGKKGKKGEKAETAEAGAGRSPGARLLLQMIGS